MKNIPTYNILRHLILVFGCLFLMLPIWIIFASSTQDPAVIEQYGMQLLPGAFGFLGYKEVLTGNNLLDGVSATRMLLNSFIIGLGFAVGKVIISILTAYGLVYFRFRGASIIFALIFSTLLLPLEIRVGPTYEVMSKIGSIPLLGTYLGLNSYGGLIIPLIASATATFYFRQFFKSIPKELLEAAKLDNAGPYLFFKDILLPLSKTMIAAIFIIMFVEGWNQYLWPLIMTTKPEYTSIIMGLQNILVSIQADGSKVPEYHKAFALAILALVPPVFVIVVFQRWFVKGLVESEK